MMDGRSDLQRRVNEYATARINPPSTAAVRYTFQIPHLETDKGSRWISDLLQPGTWPGKRRAQHSSWRTGWQTQWLTKREHEMDSAWCFHDSVWRDNGNAGFSLGFYTWCPWCCGEIGTFSHTLGVLCGASYSMLTIVSSYDSSRLDWWWGCHSYQPSTVPSPPYQAQPEQAHNRILVLWKPGQQRIVVSM